MTVTDYTDVNKIPEVNIELQSYEIKDNRSWFKKFRMWLPWSRWKRSSRRIMKMLHEPPKIDMYFDEEAFLEMERMFNTAIEKEKTK